MRGLKSIDAVQDILDYEVAPFTGAWIEIQCAWEVIKYFGVAPFTGAWIEITGLAGYLHWDKVAPFTGAWIEIFRFLEKPKGKSICRTLRGCVD